MKIPYRTQRLLQRIGLIALVVLVVGGLVFFCWFTWLQRYVIYTREEGAIINMKLPPAVALGEEAVPNPKEDPISIYYNEGENAINVSKDLTQMTGYYADAAALEKSVSTVFSQAKALPAGTPIMLDVKSPKGNFFYSSSVSDKYNPDLDVTKMDEMIAALDKKGMYLIARLPAFRDYNFGLAHTSNGLYVASGAHLWADDDYCYWLNPASEGTIQFLVEIVTELKALGFDEVVFDEFRFPSTKDLKFSGDKDKTIATAAKTIATACAGDNFAVSFVGSAKFPLPAGRTRLYVEGADAAEVADIAKKTGLENPAISLVFLTDNHDTRFESYSVLRPLEAAH